MRVWDLILKYCYSERVTVLNISPHFHLYRTERKKYHHHREKSRSQPTKCVTIIIDGMDQAKTNLPNTKIIAKSTSSLWRLRTHVTGILLHTKAPYGKLAFAFVDLLQWPHDSNLTITLLLNAILEFQKNNSLPSTLYLQMDNTARENKNKYVLGFCAALVELRIFQKVKGFLTKPFQSQCLVTVIHVIH